LNPAEFATLARAEQELWWFRGMRQIMFRLLDPLVDGRKIERVLEAGCGTGHFAATLQQRYGWIVYPADLAREGLEVARGAGLRRLVQTDIARLPYADAAFDALVCMDVLVHFARGEERGPLAEFARVLRPGGLLVLRVSALDLLRSRHSIFTHERQRFTRTRLIRLARDAGFALVRSTYANSLLLPIAGAKFRLWEPLLRKPPASGTAPVAGWLDRLLNVPLALESKLIGAGVSFPLGQSLILIADKQ
jgi:SAM-dependent methyltransferase